MITVDPAYKIQKLQRRCKKNLMTWRILEDIVVEAEDRLTHLGMKRADLPGTSLLIAPFHSEVGTVVEVVWDRLTASWVVVHATRKKAEKRLSITMTMDSSILAKYIEKNFDIKTSPCWKCSIRTLSDTKTQEVKA